MICVLADDALLVHGSQKKLDFLRASADASAAAGQPVRLRLLPREKGDATVAANRSALDALLAAVAAAGNKLATFPQDRQEGAMAQGWQQELAAAGVALEDGLRGAEAYLAVKDEDALAEMRAAGKLAARVLREVALKDVEGAIEDEKRVSNAELAAASAAVVQDRAQLEKRKVPVDTDQYDQALPLVVQSGGQYVIDFRAAKDGAPLTSANTPLRHDVVILSLAMRYKGMRATCARTYLIDPTPRMTRVYDAIEAAQLALIARLTPGTVIKDAVTAVRDSLLGAGIPLEAQIGRNFGSGVGARLSDRHLVLSHRNEAVVEAGMCFTVSVCLSDIPMDDKHVIGGKESAAPVNQLKSYAIVLADTIVVAAEGPPQVVTDKAPRSRKEISYELINEDDEEEGDEEEEEEEEEGDDDDAAARRAREKKKKAAAASGGGGSKRPKDFDASAGRDATGRSARLREKAKEVDPEAAEKRLEQQRAIVKKLQDEMTKKLSGGAAAADEEDELENAPDIVGYRSTSDFPKGTRPNQIVVDKARDCVLVPLLGMLVPFHISTIKSCVKSEEGHKSLLRINFYSAGQAVGKDAAPSMQAAVQRHPDALFVRSLNFMSRDGRNFVDVDQKIKSMLKAHRTQRKEEKETSGVVEQPRLIHRREGAVPKVVDIHMWPSIGGRGRTQGTLAAHVNGLLFQSNKGESLEIIYRNIKSAIFQPCENEHVVLMHFHLRHSILVGKKKFRDLQFYTEVVESSQALDARGGGGGYDADELLEEEREQKLKARLNKAYKYFVQKVEDATADDKSGTSARAFEVPARDLAFNGSWAKEMRTILLGASAIVSVVDKPPLVVPIEDIEFVHFERVVQGGKSFDMVIVLKAGVADKGADEFVSISQIETKHKETICTWLNDVAEVVYTETTETLMWKQLIAEEVRDPHFWLEEDAEGNPKNIGIEEVLHPFAESGGGGGGGEGEEGDEDDDEDEETPYEETEDSDDESSYDEDEEEDGDSEGDDDDDEDASGGDDDDDESEASWSKLEKKAAASDRKHVRDGGSDDDAEERKRAKKSRK